MAFRAMAGRFMVWTAQKHSMTAYEYGETRDGHLPTRTDPTYPSRSATEHPARPLRAILGCSGSGRGCSWWWCPQSTMIFRKRYHPPSMYTVAPPSIRADFSKLHAPPENLKKGPSD